MSLLSSKNKYIHHLPLEAYTTKSWFDAEQRQIFSKNWAFAGFIEDIKEPGDYITVQAGLNNLFVIMGPDEQLRAFHNICRHRGTQLLRAAGKGGKAITCPYHDWTYALTGELISVPEEQDQFGGVDKSCLGLKKASFGMWRGMIFVHPEEEAEPVQSFFAPIEPFLGPHKPEELVEFPDSATNDEIKANWKIVVENYIDHYHLAHLHSGTLSMYDHKQAEFGFHGPHFAFKEPLVASYADNIKSNAPYPLIVPEDHFYAYVPMLFPSLGLGESEVSWSIFHIIPLAPDLTRVITRTKMKNASSLEYMRQSWKSSSFWDGRVRGKYSNKDKENSDDPMLSGDFMAEDIYACEQQQKSLQSPYFEVGPAAKGEQPILDFQKIILGFLQKDEAFKEMT